MSQAKGKQPKVSKRQKEFDAFRAQMISMQQQQHQTEKTERVATAEGLGQKLASLEKTLETIRTQNESQAKQMQSQGTQIQSQANLIQSQANQIQLQANQIQLQANQIQSQANQLEAQANQIQAQANQLESLAKECENLRKNNEDLKQQVHQLQQRINELEGENETIMKQSDKEMNEMKVKVSELQEHLHFISNHLYLRQLAYTFLKRLTMFLFGIEKTNVTVAAALSEAKTVSTTTNEMKEKLEWLEKQMNENSLDEKRIDEVSRTVRSHQFLEIAHPSKLLFGKAVKQETGELVKYGKDEVITAITLKDIIRESDFLSLETARDLENLGGLICNLNVKLHIQPAHGVL